MQHPTHWALCVELRRSINITTLLDRGGVAPGPLLSLDSVPPLKRGVP
jgi:hypothetical protein